MSQSKNEYETAAQELPTHVSFLHVFHDQNLFFPSG